jgi:hypothetical protein
MGADSLEEAGHSLARKVASSLHGASVTCEVLNKSSLQSTQFGTFAAAFQEELLRRGVKILTAEAPVAIILTVTQNPTEYLGVLQIQRNETTETLLETIGPVKGTGAPEAIFTLTLHRELLFSQDGPILDVVLDDDTKHAQALGPQEIGFYEWRGSQWIWTGSERLPLHRLDRGGSAFIYHGVDTYAAYLQGEVCTIYLNERKGWSCEKYADPMPVRTVSEEAMLGKKLMPWSSAAQFETEGKTKIVVTGKDGLARLYTEGPEPVAVFPNWGSEIASLSSGCGNGWQLLVTGKEDWTKQDQIQAVDIQEQQARAVSDPMEFPGPVVVLHTPGMRTTTNAVANAKAVAVDRNLQSGRYEAYLLSITCSN